MEVNENKTKINKNLQKETKIVKDAIEQTTKPEDKKNQEMHHVESILLESLKEVTEECRSIKEKEIEKHEMKNKKNNIKESNNLNKNINKTRLHKQKVL